MRNEPERQAIHHALEEATSGLRENPFLYERVKARITEGEPVVKKKISLSLILALALMAITLTGLAAGLLFGQEWYQSIREGLVEASPEKYTAIKSHLTVPVEQWNTAQSLVDMIVQDVAWVPEEKVLSVSARATLKDTDHYELYPMWDLDADGSYVGSTATGTPDEDSEGRAEHWLWRHDADSDAVPRHGCPADMMDEPGKTLVLIETDDLLLKQPAIMSLWDGMRLSDGSCLFYFEYNLSNVDEEQDDSSHNVIFAETYSLPYRVVIYTDDITDEELYLGGEKGTLTFTVEAQ